VEAMEVMEVKVAMEVKVLRLLRSPEE